MLESVYETCLFHELRTRNLFVERQKPIPIVYGDVSLEAGLRLDFLVENCVIVEIKATDEWHKVFEAQLLTYLKLSGLRLGLPINFNVPTIRQGIRRRAL